MRHLLMQKLLTMENPAFNEAQIYFVKAVEEVLMLTTTLTSIELIHSNEVLHF